MKAFTVTEMSSGSWVSDRAVCTTCTTKGKMLSVQGQVSVMVSTYTAMHAHDYLFHASSCNPT